MAYPTFTDVLMQAKRKSQLTNRNLSNRDVEGIASGYFDTARARTLNERRLALQAQGLEQQRSQFADTLAQQKAEMEAQKDAAGKATKQGYVNTGIQGLGTAALIKGAYPSTPGEPGLLDLYNWGGPGSVGPGAGAPAEATAQQLTYTNPQGNVFAPSGSTPAPVAETSQFGTQTAAEAGAASGAAAAEGAVDLSTAQLPAGTTEAWNAGNVASGEAASGSSALGIAGEIVGPLGAGYGAGKLVGKPVGGALFPSGSNFAQASGGGIITGGIAGSFLNAEPALGAGLGMLGGALSAIGVKNKPNIIPFNPDSTDWRDWHPSRQIGWVPDPNGPVMGTDGRLYSKTPGVAGDIPAMNFDQFLQWNRQGGFDRRTDTSNMGV